jgi:hypothetical protein
MVSLLQPNACIAAFTSIRNPALLSLQLVKFRPTFLGLQAASKLFWHQYAPGTCIFVQMAEFSQKKTLIDICTGSLQISICSLDRVGCHIPDDRGMSAFLDIKI